MYDSEGYGDEADRRRLSKMSYLDRECLLADRREERKRRKQGSTPGKKSEKKSRKIEEEKISKERRPTRASRAVTSSTRRAGAKSKLEPLTGSALVGKRVELESSSRRGLVVQCKEDSDEEERQLYRMVWDDGQPDEWVCLEVCVCACVLCGMHEKYSKTQLSFTRACFSIDIFFI
jgi:hypothetical protein